VTPPLTPGRPGSDAPAATAGADPAAAAASPGPPGSGTAPGVPARPDTDLTLPEGDDVAVAIDDGAALAVRVVPGRAESGLAPVVLSHCWTGSRLVWVPVARRLAAAGHQVVLYDQRGHGASTRGSAAISVERLGADLAAVLAHLDLRDAVVAGHSMGGMGAMAFACHHADMVRERVRGLVLVATAAHGVGGGPRRYLWQAVLRGDVATWVMTRPGLGRRFVRPVFGVDPAPEHVEVTRVLFAATPAEVRLDCVRAMGSMDLRAVLRRADVPAVVLLGRRDQLLVNRLTRAIVDHLAGARLVELPDAGHMLPFERPDEVADTIRRVAGPAPYVP
jgi:pimeloyl-ACP methyl ester carboxylesterase